MALHHDPDSKSSCNQFYAGFVVEEATTSNLFRYLIMFDNEHVAYVKPDFVFVNFNQSRDNYIESMIKPKNEEFGSFLTKIFENDSLMITKVVVRKNEKGKSNFNLIKSNLVLIS